MWKNAPVFALPEAVFDHRPASYRVTSMRQASPREEDAARFQRKWGLRPVGQAPFRPSPRQRSRAARLLRRLTGRT